jgi:hypothetical protein
MVLWIILALVIALGAYIRLAPSKAEDWHQPVDATASKDLEGGAIRVVDAGPDALAKLHEVAMETPRTVVLAGSPAEGRVTYVTRTKVIGFPDYTTVEQEGETLKIFARLRFGKKDFGVNKARVDGWLGALGAQ